MIRLANENDLPNLRQWKNDHREAFFHKDEISEDQQIQWFREYQGRPNDFMFMVVLEDIPLGCMAIRLIDESGNFERKSSWDIYNIILGLPEYGKKGIMSGALKSMIQFALSKHFIPVRTKVLKDNPAVDWYRNNGFIVTSENFDLRPSDHYVMTYQGEV